MSITLDYGRIFNEDTWGATFKEVLANSTPGNIFICHASITDLEKIAAQLSTRVTDQSWIIELDHRSRRAYENTALKTAKKLIEVFKGDLSVGNKVSSEFGELMVSMGSSRALEVIFRHRSLPIAELWKPKLLQNEGFDFHTVCEESIINFGEAKFSSSSSPYGGNTGESSGAGGQADGFIGEGKHLMDNVHLGSVASPEAANNLDSDLFGIVLGFSINADNPLVVLRNALNQVETYDNLKKAKNIYIVGLSYDSEN